MAVTGAPVRSLLFLPAANPRAVAKARTLDCDMAILDLEDAVAPEARADARQAACDAVRQGDFRPRLAVRVNAPDTAWFIDDLTALAQAGAACVIIPKVETVQALATAHGLLGDDCGLWPMIETPRGLFALETIVQAKVPLEGLMPGVNDLAVALGVDPGTDRAPLLPWLGRIVAAARMRGIAVVDGVFNRLDDEDALKAECAQGAAWGFDGKGLIHPNQIAAAHAAFSPSPEAVERARRIVAAFDAPENRDQGVIRLDGTMVERLHLDQARTLLARHAAIAPDR